MHIVLILLIYKLINLTLKFRPSLQTKRTAGAVCGLVAFKPLFIKLRICLHEGGFTAPVYPLLSSPPPFWACEFQPGKPSAQMASPVYSLAEPLP